MVYILQNIFDTVLLQWGLYKTTLFSAHSNRMLDAAIDIFH